MKFLESFITILSTALVFGVLIFIHEFGHFLTARLCKVNVYEFAIGMGPTVFSWKSKKYDTKYAIRAFPIGGFVRMEGEDEASEGENAFCNKSVFKRFLIVASGPFMNIMLGFLLMSIIVTAQPALYSATVSGFSENAISNQKLETGDTIIAIGASPVFSANEAIYEIMYQGDKPVDIVVIRDGKTVFLKDVEFPTFTESGATLGDLDLGFALEEKNPLTVVKHMLGRSFSTIKMTFDSIFGLVTGRFGLDSVSGPVGVAGVVGDAVKLGFLNFLYIVVVLSMNLGVFNLIPFPALDGGRILFLIIEAIRKKPIKKEVESYINFIGFTVLLAVMIFVMGKDVINLIRR